MSTEVIIAVIVALSGGGGIVALYRAWGDRKRGAQDATMQGFKSVIDTLREEVDRLKKDREQDRARIDRIEREVSDERDAKWAAVQHIRVLYAWITRHIPGVDPPAVPDDLAPYVIIPRKDHDS